MSHTEPDFLQDVINRLAAAITATQDGTPDRVLALRQVETSIRRDYGHDRIRVSLGKDERNAQIRRDYLAGHHTLRDLARLYELTPRRIIQIAKGDW